MATTAQAAKLLGVTPSMVREYIKAGKLPAERRHGRRKVGRGRLWIPDEALAQFAAQPDLRGKPGRPSKLKRVKA